MEDFLEFFEVGFMIVCAALMGLYLTRLFLARRIARKRKPVLAKVVAVIRKELDDNRVFSYGVDTIYEVPGHGELAHWKGFETEGQAILFSRLHKEGTSHKVVPDTMDPGKVFLWEELTKMDTNLVYALFVGLAVIASCAYAIVEYYKD
jgi:hypothetical protein